VFFSFGEIVFEVRVDKLISRGVFCFSSMLEPGGMMMGRVIFLYLTDDCLPPTPDLANTPPA